MKSTYAVDACISVSPLETGQNLWTNCLRRGELHRPIMKFADGQKLQDAGFISDEQRQKIVEHFKLREDSSRFLFIISFVGAALVAASIVLLIAANWDAISRGVKLVTGPLLMVAAHAGNWWLRGTPLTLTPQAASLEIA